ncbi:nuclease-related domain-containing protein [Lysinibacillus sp. fls2-241-R2A-57]|uniref:nuclease-related domain-containing protein n=1 Tax=Lysinibacillus sp. fls2-241-R2A-57 TaxID=3040292 RepID=UPI002556130C|nr:nuclease-related domain-containing protein [Lysinibacillus sp. fls2-241-R2A-57]
MILKPFEQATMIEGLRALVQRLDPSHPLSLKISKELQQLEAGDFGEQSIIRALQKLSQSLEISILHNITLFEPVPIQLDVVVITPNSVVVIESKNIRGNIELKRSPRQMVRVLENGDKHIFNHPEIQLEEFIFGLSTFFKQHKVQVEVIGIIVFPFNNAEVYYEEGKYPVIMRRELTHFLRQHINNSKSQKMFPTAKIANLLLKYHRVFQTPPLCIHYKIDPQDIKKGIFCRHCHQSKLIRQKQSWFCPKCEIYDKTASNQALRDYCLLIDEKINTETARCFLEVSNRHLAKRIIQKYTNKKEGDNNQTIYYLKNM